MQSHDTTAVMSHLATSTTKPTCCGTMSNCTVHGRACRARTRSIIQQFRCRHKVFCSANARFLYNILYFLLLPSLSITGIALSLVEILGAGSEGSKEVSRLGAVSWGMCLVSTLTLVVQATSILSPTMIPYKPIINSPFASRFPLVITLLCIILSIYEIVTSKVHGKNWMEKTQTDKKEQKHVVVLLLAALSLVSLITSITARYHRAAWMAENPDWNKRSPDWTRFAYVPNKARWWQVWSALKESIRGPKPAPLLPTTEVRVAVVDESTEKEKDCWDAIREDAGQRLEEEG